MASTVYERETCYGDNQRTLKNTNEKRKKMDRNLPVTTAKNKSFWPR